MFCLSVAAGLLIWGRTFLLGHLHGWVFACYWASCLAFAAGAVTCAVAEIWSIRRQRQRDRAELVQQTFEKIRQGPSDE